MLNQHPVFIALATERRRELLSCPDFAALSEGRKVQLLDEVMKVRASLDSDDNLAAFSDQRQRMADAAVLKEALETALTVLGRQRQIAVDVIDGLADHHRGYDNIGEAMVEMRACEGTMRRMLATVKALEAEPRDDQQRRTRRMRGEAWLLRWALEAFDVKVALTTPDKHGPANSSLALLGLLADPPASPDAMRKRLRPLRAEGPI